MRPFEKIIIILFLFACASCLLSCKKDGNNIKKNTNVVGEWVNNTPLADERGRKLIILIFGADGSGKHIVRTESTEIRVLYDDVLTWTSDNDKVLRYTIDGLDEEVFGFSISDDGNTLQLTNKFGDVVPYRKK